MHWIHKTIYSAILMLFVCLNILAQESGKASPSDSESNDKQPVSNYSESVECGYKDYDCVIARETKKIAEFRGGKVPLKEEQFYFISYIIRADAYYEKGDYLSALRDYNYLTKSDFLCCSAEIGRVYEKLGRYDDALQHYRKASKTSTIANLGIGNIYIRQRKYESSLEHFDSVIFLDVRNAEAYLGRGTAYLELGKIHAQSAAPEEREKSAEFYRKAVKDLEQVIELDLENLYKEAYLRRAKAYDRLGEPEKARADRQKYEELSLQPRK